MRFVVFDSWRGICALLVVLFHFDGFTHFYDWSFVRHAWLFVDFFFVLSGFVITLADEKRLTDIRADGAFMVRRFGRLWPLHASMLALLLVNELVKYALVSSGKLDPNFAPFSGTTSTPAIFTNLLLIQSLGIHDQLTWNVPSWSISVEFATYLVYALFCLLTLRMRPMVRYGVGAAVAGIAAFVVFYFSPTFMKTDFDFGIFRCIYGFFVGSLACQISRKGIAPNGVWEIPALVIVIAYVSMTGATSGSMLAPLVFAGALLAFSSQSGILSRALKAAPFVLLGKWSYSIYLVHWVLFVVLAQVTTLAEKFFHESFHVMHQPAVAGLPATRLVFIGSRFWMDGEAIGMVAAVILVSAFTYRFVEEPGRRFFKRLAERMYAGRKPALVAAE